jgi:hypothetical protein
MTETEAFFKELPGLSGKICIALEEYEKYGKLYA